MTLRSAPPCSRCVAKVCLRVWGVTLPLRASRREYFWTMRRMLREVSRLPRVLRKNALLLALHPNPEEAFLHADIPHVYPLQFTHPEPA